MTQQLIDTDLSKVYRQGANCEGDTTPQTVNPNATSHTLKNQSWEIELLEFPTGEPIMPNITYPTTLVSFPLINLKAPGQFYKED